MEILSTISHITSMHISFHQKLDSIQYNAALATTGAIRGTSREKPYHELGFESSLVSRRWCRQLYCVYNGLKS